MIPPRPTDSAADKQKQDDQIYYRQKLLSGFFQMVQYLKLEGSPFFDWDQPPVDRRLFQAKKNWAPELQGAPHRNALLTAAALLAALLANSPAPSSTHPRHDKKAPAASSEEKKPRKRVHFDAPKDEPTPPPVKRASQQTAAASSKKQAPLPLKSILVEKPRARVTTLNKPLSSTPEKTPTQAIRVHRDDFDNHYKKLKSASTLNTRELALAIHLAFHYDDHKWISSLAKTYPLNTLAEAYQYVINVYHGRFVEPYLNNRKTVFFLSHLPQRDAINLLQKQPELLNKLQPDQVLTLSRRARESDRSALFNYLLSTPRLQKIVSSPIGYELSMQNAIQPLDTIASRVQRYSDRFLSNLIGRELILKTLCTKEELTEKEKNHIEKVLPVILEAANNCPDTEEQQVYRELLTEQVFKRFEEAGCQLATSLKDLTDHPRFSR